MIIAIGKSRKDTRWHNTEMTWSAFVGRLEEPYRTRETVKEYKAMIKADRDAAKDIGGFVGGSLSGPRRKAENVRDRSLITLDLDDAAPDAWDAASMWGWTCAMYSTHSHTPESPRLRLIYPLDRTVTVDEYQAIARKIAFYVGIEQMDPSTYEPSRLMYWPSCPSDGEYVFRQQEGDTLCADDILAEYGLDDAWRDSRLWPTAKVEAEVRVREAKRQGNPTEKAGIVGLFCRAYDIPDAISTFLPDVYVEGSAGRYTYAAGSTSDGAVLYDNDQFLYSHHGTDPCGGQLVNAFDLVRIHRFGAEDDGKAQDDVTKLPSYRKMCDLAAGDPGVKRELAAERAAEAASHFGDLEDLDSGDDGAGTEDTAAADAGPDPNWTENLKVNRKTGEADALIENAVLILRNDPHLRRRFGYNAFRSKLCIREPLPWHPKVRDKRNGDSWEDEDDAGLRLYLEVAWKLKAKAAIEDALGIVARENQFDPVRQYLEELTWDGVERLDTVLIRLFGAEDSRYVRAITRKWAVAGVRRIFEPGCKFDTMLVLIGDQGCGKSQFARVMSRGWFCDSIQRIDNKDAYDQLLGTWIVEMSELSATKKADNEAIKAFYSKQVDTFRQAYAHRTAEFPRRCIFIGTTNDRSFIKDETGGRRFWPVELTAQREDVVERLAATEAEADQLWAEALVRYKAGERTWEDDNEVLEQAREAQIRYAQEDEWQGMIEQYLATPLPDNWDDLNAQQRRDYIQGNDLTTPEQRAGYTRLRDKVSVAEIRYELFGEDLKRGAGGSNETSRHVARLMNVMRGWEKAKNPRWTLFGKQKCYVRAGQPGT